MFRMTQFMKSLAEDTPLGPARKPPGPVVIWNLVRRCNLTCKHCYSISADKDFPGELTTEQVFTTMDDLKQFKVPVLILSGGEPLLRPDIFDISHRAKEMGFYVGLSTNGTLITEDNIKQIAEVGYDYVGISIDGMEKTHDMFRRREGAFKESMHGIDLCKENGIKVGLRFTLTQDTVHELPDILNLMDERDIDKFYLSHLNYAGRGNKNRKDDVFHKMTRTAMDLLFDVCWDHIQRGNEREFVTGNNDADGIYMMLWAKKNIPEIFEGKESELITRLENWGGNASGVNISNIDNLGNVHPDTFWWDYNLGNVKERKFSEIWQDTSDPLMAGFKQEQRPLKGRCAECEHKAICGGNTRVRAYQLTGDPWEEDPACYLSDEEIGVESSDRRVENRPYDGRLKDIKISRA
ncbi:MAG: heme d1 biosynthesis radical SAM protein NirJ [endosymbiont of Galathealinum brachiosum]|uniref:Pre-heme d1 synthase n=1 Tax=endosymbiont of Galathealinum brachiosum TaxID=2200906 RepID=A0A370DMQ6_9GAMM|nr:MAG: heme d1 biosynthesis radical SAM protein NirJ [endosymbiont of Galathealinum brachiosum]